MTDRQPPTPPAPNPDYRVNFFRPRPGQMRAKVRYLWVLLASWAIFALGFQLVLAIIGQPPHGESRLTAITVFGFPFHFWFTGHFLIVWFIILCVFYNLFIDRLADQHRKRK